MKVHLTPETAKRLNALAAASGLPPEDIVEAALTSYLAGVTMLRKTLRRRYEDLKSGRAEAIDGDEALQRMREKSKRRRLGG